MVIVDDDPDIRFCLKSWADLLGLQSTVHVCAESLLDAIRVDAPRLIGAVLDLDLPGISGFELANRLRHMAPELPLVIITGMPVQERSAYGIAPAGIPCLSKPFDLDALEQALGLFQPWFAATEGDPASRPRSGSTPLPVEL